MEDNRKMRGMDRGEGEERVKVKKRKEMKNEEER